jgi:hypothetical protein
MYLDANMFLIIALNLLAAGLFARSIIATILGVLGLLAIAI